MQRSFSGQSFLLKRLPFELLATQTLLALLELVLLNALPESIDRSLEFAVRSSSVVVPRGSAWYVHESSIDASAKVLCVALTKAMNAKLTVATLFPRDLATRSSAGVSP